jgi:hypothetical protein
MNRTSRNQKAQTTTADQNNPGWISMGAGKAFLLGSFLGMLDP